MKKAFLYWLLSISIIISGMFFIGIIEVQAGVKGKCANCHTMHNNQDGVELNERGQPSLINVPLDVDNPCLGCHARSYTEAIVDGAPQVTYYSSDEDEMMLAGGTYHFVTNNEDEDGEKKSCQKGHNVFGINDCIGTDPRMSSNDPPGGTRAINELTCAGTSGCHGDRSVGDPLASIKGGHHSSVSDNNRDGSDIAHSYRMLLGVKGRVANKWELGKSNALLNDHELSDPNSNINVYRGVSLAESGGLQGDDISPGTGGSINGFCGECHGNAMDGEDNGFHSLAGIIQGADPNSPWIRHPTDVKMDKGEYNNYPNDTVGTTDYSTEVPVGFINHENPQSTERVVLCISCHRAHGSQYNDALRWSYEEMQTGAEAGNGCFRCHTQKNK